METRSFPLMLLIILFAGLCAFGIVKNNFLILLIQWCSLGVVFLCLPLFFNRYVRARWLKALFWVIPWSASCLVFIHVHSWFLDLHDYFVKNYQVVQGKVSDLKVDVSYFGSIEQPQTAPNFLGNAYLQIGDKTCIVPISMLSDLYNTEGHVVRIESLKNSGFVVSVE